MKINDLLFHRKKPFYFFPNINSNCEMSFFNHRTIILALIVTILVLILVRNGAPRGISPIDRSALVDLGLNPNGSTGGPGDTSGPAGTPGITVPGSIMPRNAIQDPNNPNIAIFQNAPLVAPLASPLYTQLSFGREKMNIADYTGVPINVSAPMKCIEDPSTFIVDRKYAPITNGTISEKDHADLIINVNRDLAIAMSGLNNDCGPCATQNKTPDGVWKMWSDLPVFIRGLILEKSRTTNDKLNQDLIDKNLSDEEIQASYHKDMNFMTKLPIDVCCDDVEENCPAWALNNQCVTNPDFMLLNCPKSCGSCKMSSAQIKKLTKLDLTRTPPNCATTEGGIVP
jgi:hypothetical protein